MDFTTGSGRVMQRQIRYQLALAERRRCLINVTELASRLARKYRRSSPALVELSNEIALRAAKAGLAVYLSTPGEQMEPGARRRLNCPAGCSDATRVAVSQRRHAAAAMGWAIDRPACPD